MFTFNLIKFSKEYGKFIKIGLPILGSQLVMYGMTTVDYIMAGYYSSDDLAGVGLAAAIYSPISVSYTHLRAHETGRSRMPSSA